jgi:hypothetical protein
MRNHRLLVLWLLPLLLVPLFAPCGYAGVFFGKKNKKPTPMERVPELLAQVKTDGDESKRVAAAQELRQYDPQQFPMIVPVLAEVLLSDKKPAVRAEAAQSIGKLRPISQQAGTALEQALANDASMRVRLQARSSLMQYHWNGYHNVRKDDLVPQTKEPPLADDKTPPPIISTTLPPRQPDGSRSMSGYRPPAPFPYPPSRSTTNEPPLAPVAPATPPVRGGNEGGPDLTPP